MKISKQSIGLQINKLCLASMFLALAWLFPLLTGQIQSFGTMLLPLHIPIFIGGFVLGPIYGLFLGIIAPLTRSLIFGMPPLFPTATAMAIELGVYGFLSGLLFKLFLKGNLRSHKDKEVPQENEELKDEKENGIKAFFGDNYFKVLVSLIIAQIAGRLVWGLTSYLFTFTGVGVSTEAFTWTYFITQVLLSGWPGIILQIVLIPALIRLLYEFNLIQKFMPNYSFRRRKFEEDIVEEDLD